MSEAPPAIISVYVGDELEAVLDYLDSGKPLGPSRRENLRIGVDALPPIPRDNSDRNRTSPFAFTGNKFEFRMLGSSMSGADCTTVLNTIVAESLGMFADALEGAEDFNATLHELLRATVKRHRRIVFNGNGYSGEWREEAARRGLSNKPSAAEALCAWADERNVELFARRGVLSPEEMRALNADVVLWPIWCDYKAEEWNGSINQEYAEQAALCGDCVLLVNPFCNDPDAEDSASGGASHYACGRIVAAEAAGSSGVLIVEV